MGPIAFSAQYQQSPLPPGGRIIKRNWLTTYDEVQSQPGDRIIMSWDIALSETESGDYSACVVLTQRGVFSCAFLGGTLLRERLARRPSRRRPVPCISRVSAAMSLRQ